MLSKTWIKLVLNLTRLLDSYSKFLQIVCFPNKCQLKESRSKVANEFFCQQAFRPITYKVDDIFHLFVFWQIEIDLTYNGRPPWVTSHLGPDQFFLFESKPTHSSISVRWSGHGSYWLLPLLLLSGWCRDSTIVVLFFGHWNWWASLLFILMLRFTTIPLLRLCQGVRWSSRHFTFARIAVF